MRAITASGVLGKLMFRQANEMRGLSGTKPGVNIHFTFEFSVFLVAAANHMRLVTTSGARRILHGIKEG